MPAVENKALIRRFYEEAWDQGQLDVIDEVFRNDYIRHDLRSSRAAPGSEGQKRITADFRTAFPDLRFEVEIMVAEDDFVAARWTASGTHTGPWGAVGPTGRRVSLSGCASKLGSRTVERRALDDEHREQLSVVVFVGREHVDDAQARLDAAG